MMERDEGWMKRIHKKKKINKNNDKVIHMKWATGNSTLKKYYKMSYFNRKWTLIYFQNVLLCLFIIFSQIFIRPFPLI